MAIMLRNVTKKFPIKEPPGSIPVLNGFDLDVDSGKIVALFGPNGCGKTTALNIAAGIETADSGEVSLTANDSHRQRVGYVFQNFREVLLPWESALENVGFGLRASGVPPVQARKRAASFLDKYGFIFPRENYPYQLSVGQQQTVALARALIQNPANILLDEPFSALDHEARFRMQDLVELVIRTEATAGVLVSHDVDEALYLGDELILLSKRPGRVIRRLEIPFARPRRHDLLATAEFASLRREVVAAFLKEVQA